MNEMDRHSFHTRYLEKLVTPVGRLIECMLINNQVTNLNKIIQNGTQKIKQRTAPLKK
jgi:hypothetical protein